MTDSSCQDPQKNIIIVSGLPRSGTSMMMRMLEAGGLDVLVDNIRTPDADNPQGYYEFEEVKTLQDGNTTWLGEAQGKVVKVIAALIPYLPGTYAYRIISMRRALPEILASQRKMLVNMGKDPDVFDAKLIASIYEKHLKQVNDWLSKQSNVENIEISYNDLLSDPQSQINQINAFLGGGLDAQRMAKIIDPKLYRQRNLLP